MFNWSIQVHQLFEIYLLLILTKINKKTIKNDPKINLFKQKYLNIYRIIIINYEFYDVIKNINYLIRKEEIWYLAKKEVKIKSI